MEDRGTTHLSIVDADGNAVALTSTVNTEFGSKFLSPSTGILMNNQMDDFSSPGVPNFFGLAPSESNYIRPHKRPLSSMSPTFVFRNGQLRMVLGASGGPKIITAVIQTIINKLNLGLDLFDSVSSPRIHDQLLYHGEKKCVIGDERLLQPGVGGEGELKILNNEREVAALLNRGHELIKAGYMGTVQAITIDEENGLIEAMSDVRKNGVPSGY